jgi:hypothetical protein
MSTLATLGLVVSAGCDRVADADPYDPSRMVLGAPPATVSGNRNSGPHAEGAALSLGAELGPLSPGDVKTIRLDATHKLVEIAPGVVYSAWTLVDQVPGPSVRARVGDRVRFTMPNRSDEAVPGPRLTTAPLMHSMDFHSAMVAPERRTEDWITRFLADPQAMLASDPDAQALLARYQVPMPDQNLSDAEIRRFITYFRWADENAGPGTP